MKRIERVRALMLEAGVEALIVDNPIDLLYLTNQEVSLGRLLITKDTASLYVDGRYYEGCKQNADVTVRLLEGQSEQSSFFKEWSLQGQKVGFDSDFTTVAQFEGLKKLPAMLTPLKSPVKQVRAMKDEEECALLKKAASLGSEGFDFACTLLREGVTEREIARELEFFWRKNGAERLAFPPHIAFGEGSAHPHYHPSDRPLKRGELVLMDFGVVLDHYNSDMTRVIFFGKPDEKVARIYSVVLEAMQAAFKLCKPGVSVGELDSTARQVIEKNGYGKFFPHSLGHGVGLEIHELPFLRSTDFASGHKLEAGMVITIEPGIYLPGEFGIRLEDTVLITDEGYENLTARPLPKHLPTLESK